MSQPRKEWPNLGELRRIGGPWGLLVKMPESQVGDLPLKFNGKVGEPTVRILRGKRMRSGGAAFSEMSAALQFPYYFGENWNAASECLRDLAWMPASGYVIVVSAALELFADDLPQLESFAGVCERAALHWSEPIALGENWDRPARPFHLLFQADDAD